MVGMSGKSSEPRRGPSQGRKQPAAQPPASKPQPSLEALQMARMLGDVNPPDLADKIQQVKAVVPSRTEEEVSIALHDNDFNIEKAITTLLDSDGDQGQGEWTTTGRKGRKKLQGDLDLILAPGDGRSKPSPRTGDRGTSRAASLSTRENYGGSVHVSSERGRGRGRSQSSRGGRSTSGRRSDRTRPAGKNVRGSAPKERAKLQSGVTTNTAVHSPTPALWDTLQPSESPLEPLPALVGPGFQPWEQEQPRIDELVSGLEAESSVFPEALPTSQQLTVVNTTSSAETTHAHTITSHERVQQPPSEHSKFIEIAVGRPTRHKHKRLARSQIPTKPVEMPGGVDTLDVEFSNLGINFVGLGPEEADIPTPPPPSTSPPFTTTASPQTAALLTYSERLPEDPGVISITPTSLAVEPYPPLEDTKLEAPPGLPHPPSSQPGGSATPTQLLPPEPISLPTSHPSPPHPSTEDSTALVLQATNSEPSTLTLSSHTSTLHALSTTTSLPPPIELPSSVTLTTGSTTHIEPPSSQLTPHSFSTVSNPATDLLLHNPHSATLTTTTSSKDTQPQHLGPQGKHGQLPPGLVYPHLMPQYPFSMMPYYGDPSDMGRYQATVSMYYQHPTTSDPSVAGGMTRDHSSTGFPGEVGKFGRSSDITSPVVSNPTQPQTQQQVGLQQGQQMGPAFMNAYPYANMFYPMYHPMPAGFSAPSMAPKPSGGASNYPGASSYQTPGATGFGMSYDDMTGGEFGKYGGSGLGKGSALPTTSGTSDLSSFKHDSKGGSNYGYNMQPMGSSGGYTFMQMPTVPMQGMHHMPAMVPAHDSSQTRGQPKHSSKSYGGAPFWSGTHAS